MTKPRKKSTIIPMSQIWALRNPKEDNQFVFVQHDVCEGWSIMTGRKKTDEFVFMGYQNPEDLDNAKAVTNLLTDAVAFIESEMKKEKKCRK